LEVPDRDDKAQMKTLLDHVSFKALPGDMIALMGRRALARRRSS
jgi:hypothetical protein